MKKAIEGIVFNAKWILLVFIFGLIVCLGLYAFVVIKDIGHIVVEVNHMTRAEILLHLLEFVDACMVGTLLALIIAGSYDTFISRDHGYKHENISSGMLKIKLGALLLGVSSVHLFQSFIGAKEASWDTLNKQLAIHGAFLAGLIILAITEHIHNKDKKIHHDIHKDDRKKEP